MSMDLVGIGLGPFLRGCAAQLSILCANLVRRLLVGNRGWSCRSVVPSAAVPSVAPRARIVPLMAASIQHVSDRIVLTQVNTGRRTPRLFQQSAARAGRGRHAGRDGDAVPADLVVIPAREVRPRRDQSAQGQETRHAQEGVAWLRGARPCADRHGFASVPWSPQVAMPRGRR